MSRPELAVVVPAYNEQGYIADTLSALYNQDHRANALHVLVDNGSTDGTRAEVADFLKDHDDFPLTIVEEPQKGTGSAADTGFRYAIDRGAQVIARTDADTEPHTDWSSAILRHMQDDKLRLVGGWVHPKRDEHYRIGDEILMPTAALLAPKAIAISRMDMSHSKVAVGGNLATRSVAYEEVGGFPRMAIEEIDDDVDYSVRVRRRYGRHAIKITKDMAVDTSMRRIRGYGLVNMALHHLALPGNRPASSTVDIR